MLHITCKTSTLWQNIGEVAVQNGKNTMSVYQFAHFYDDCAFFPVDVS